MSFYDCSDINIPSSPGSHLLSESPSYLNTGPGGDDLSLSELITDGSSSVFKEPFTLLAQTQAPEADEEPLADEAPEEKPRKRTDEKQREDKLRSDLVVLKKLNAAFAMCSQALDESASANERVAVQLTQTDALLNKYIDILSKSENIARLILDEQWLGAEADEEQLQQEAREAREKARREAEERAAAEQRERERLEREEKERVERERQETLAARGSVKGMRGIRVSMRGTRGSSRAVPSSATASSSRLRAPTIPQGTGRGTVTKRFTPTTNPRGASHRT